MTDARSRMRTSSFATTGFESHWNLSTSAAFCSGGNVVAQAAVTDARIPKHANARLFMVNLHAAKVTTIVPGQFPSDWRRKRARNCLSDGAQRDASSRVARFFVPAPY